MRVFTSSLSPPSSRNPSQKQVEARRMKQAQRTRTIAFASHLAH